MVAEKVLSTVWSDPRGELVERGPKRMADAADELVVARLPRKRSAGRDELAALAMTPDAGAGYFGK